MLKIEIYGSDVLREKAVAVQDVDDDLRALATEMIETMHTGNGIGLAAEQVGRREAVCVVDVPLEFDLDPQGQRLNPGIGMPLVLINPGITESSKEEDSYEEGCLSFPGISLPIKRPVSISVKYTDLKGENNEFSLKGLLARAVQHEIDHLAGVLIIDRAPKLKKLAVSGKLRQLKETTRKGEPMLS